MLQMFLAGTVGGLMAATATTAGALPSLFRKRGGAPVLHISLDFALGMMLAAASLEMIAPAGASAYALGKLAFTAVVAAVAAGALFIHSVGKLVEKTGSSFGSVKSHGAWMFVVAMMLHNLPEGLASGAAWAGMSWGKALPIVGAIALQNLPEGLMTALAFKTLGFGTRAAFLGAVASAAVELAGGSMGGVLLGWVNQGLPFVLAFAGGAMLLVSVREAKERLEDTSSLLKAHRDLVLGGLFMLVSSRVFG